MTGYQREVAEIKVQLSQSTMAQQQTAIVLERIESRVKDIAIDLDAKVSRDVYEGALARLGDRLLRLESGPQKFMQWAAVVISACSLLMVLLSALGGVLVFVISHH